MKPKNKTAKVDNLSLLVIFLAFLPAFLFTLYKGFEERRLAEKQVETEIDQAFEIVDRQFEKVFADVHWSLKLLSSSPEVQSGGDKDCSDFLANALGDYPGYVNFGVANAEGDVICSAVSLDRPINLSDRTYFLDAKNFRSFTVGTYRINRITEGPSISFGYPILGEGGEVKRIIFASLDIDLFNSLTEGVDRKENMTLTIIDKKGTVLARQPEFERWTGVSITDKPLARVVLADSNGATELEGLDGVKRLYSFAPISYGTGDSAFIAVGASREEAIGKMDRIFISTLLFLGVVTSGLVIFARSAVAIKRT